MAMSMSPTTAAAMGSVPVAKAGVGSAIINCMRQIGGSLGVAIMGALIAVHWSAGDRNPNHFVAGMQLGLHVAAGITLVAAVIAFVLVRDIAHAPHPAAVEAT
jgi:hypothetical protein